MWLKLIFIYILPVISVFGVMGLYALSYGRLEEETFNEIAFVFLLICLILSTYFSFKQVKFSLFNKKMFSKFTFYFYTILISFAWSIQVSIFLIGIYLAYSQTPL